LPLALIHLMHVTGCTTWQAQTGPLPEVVQREAQNSVRVTLADSTRFTMSGAHLAGDTLVGSSVSGVDTTEHRVARGDLSRIEARRTDGGLTALLVVLSLGTVVAVGAVAATSGMSCMPWPCD
jgi:hypothetical protein